MQLAQKNGIERFRVRLTANTIIDTVLPRVNANTRPTLHQSVHIHITTTGTRIDCTLISTRA